MVDWLVKLVIGIFFAVLGLFVYVNLERKDSIVNVGPATEVYRKHYLAAASYLEPEGIEVIERSKPPNAVDFKTDDLLIITNQRVIVSSKMASDLYEWVKSGGHLVWSMDGDYGNYPSFLSELTEVRSDYGYEHFEEIDEELRGETEDWEDAIDEDDERSISEQFEEYNQQLRDRLAEQDADDSDEQKIEDLSPSLQVAKSISDYERSWALDDLTVLPGSRPDGTLVFYQGTDTNLDHPLIYPENYGGLYGGQRLFALAGSEQGEKFIQLGVGQGTMTVMVTTDIWHNDDIGFFDHAHLLKELAGKANRVIFQTNLQWPSIWDLLLEWTLEAMLVLALIFFALLIKLSSRFGPVFLDTSDTRRSLMEHITAMAGFHWRHNHVNHLLSPLRSSVISRMRLLHAGFDELDQQQRFQLIAERSKVSVLDVEKAFFEQDTTTDWQFHQSVQLLDKIRKGL